jgi:hypothetical protein
MKILDDLLHHPMATTVGGISTVATGMVNKMFEYSDIVHGVFSYGCMAVGAAGTLMGIWAQAKNWRKNDRIKELDIAIKEEQLAKLKAQTHDA